MRAYIPPNLDDNGGAFGGFVRKRNAVEAGIYLGLIFLLLKAFSKILSPIVLIILFTVLGVPGAIIFLAGIDGKPVSREIKNRIHYKKTKGIYTLGMPIKENQHDFFRKN